MGLFSPSRQRGVPQPLSAVLCGIMAHDDSQPAPRPLSARAKERDTVKQLLVLDDKNVSEAPLVSLYRYIVIIGECATADG